MQELRYSRFKRMDLTAGGINDVHGWLGKVGKNLHEVTAEWQREPKGSFKFDSRSMGGERWVLRNKPGRPSVSGSSLSLDPVNPVGLSLQTIFHHNVTAGWFRCLKNCRKFFILSLFFALTLGRKLITKDVEHLLSFDLTNELGTGVVPRKSPLMFSAVNMSKHIRFFFSPIDVLSCLAVAKTN